MFFWCSASIKNERSNGLRSFLFQSPCQCQHACQVSAYVHVLFGNSWVNHTKNGQKLEKMGNVVTYNSFSLFQGCSRKSHLNTFHYHYNIQLCAKNQPSRPTFLSIVGKQIYQADKKYPLFDERSVTRAIAAFKYFNCWPTIIFWIKSC